MAVREIILTAQHSTAQHSTAQHSTAQHSTLTAPFLRLFIFIKKQIKASIDMYIDKMYVFVGAFLCLIRGDNLI